MVDCGIGHYLTSLQTPCAYCNSGSGLGEELNESCLDCRGMHPAGPGLSEVVLLPSGFQLLLVSRLPLGEPPNEPTPRRGFPEGWRSDLEVLAHNEEELRLYEVAPWRVAELVHQVS